MQELKNPGFEETMPNNWQTYSTGTTQIYTYPEPGRISGSSVAIEYQTREIGKVALWGQDVQIDHTIKYKLSGWIKTQNIIGTGTSIRVDWRDENGTYIDTSSIMSRQKGTITWTYFEGIVTPSTNAVKATISLDLYDCSGKVWFDDISFSGIVVKYICNNGQCIQDVSGQYNSLADCQATLKYACINNQCVTVCPDYQGTKYNTLIECQAVCRQVPPPGYNLVWSDEFNGSNLDLNKWYRRADLNSAFVQNGNLFLRLDIVNGNVKRGYINSNYKYKYGFIEIKAKVSHKLGVDNQFWLTPTGWKFEMDVAEYVPRRRQYSMNIMYKDSAGGQHWNGNNIFGALDTNYHLFQFLWDVDKYVFYRDGIEVWRVTDPKFISNIDAKIELGICGTYGYAGCSVQGVKDQITDLTGLPTDFIIDYVRIYQK